jgi:hypothetical protein
VSTANAQFVEPTHLSLLPVCFRYIRNVTSNNDNGPVAALERPLPLLGVQRLSTLFNILQRDSTLEGLAVLKRVEHLSAVTFRTSLEGRSTRSVGRESHDLKRSVRVQASSAKHQGSAGAHLSSLQADGHRLFFRCKVIQSSNVVSPCSPVHFIHPIGPRLNAAGNV